MAASAVEKAFCVLELSKTQSVTVVQRHFRSRFGKKPPTRRSIYDWHKKFETTGCLCKRTSPGRPRFSEEVVDSVCTAIQRSPGKSTRRVSRELHISQPTVWRILRKKLRMIPYKVQLLQNLTVPDKTKRFEFCAEMLHRFENDDDLADRLVFTDEATFHVSGQVNKQNVRFWGTENPRFTEQHVRDSPKVNVFCAVSKQKVYGPFFFHEKTVTGACFLDMLSLWLMPQLQDDSDNFILQLDGAPPHWSGDVRDYLDEHLPHRWIGRAADYNMPLTQWPPRSPDLTPCDFFLWGYLKDKVFAPPLPVDLPELKQRITATITALDSDILTRVWAELDYRLDVCRVTKGAHIEHL